MNADIEEHATLRQVYVKPWIYSYRYMVYIRTYMNIYVILEALSSLISTVSLYFPAPKPQKFISNKTAYYDVGSCQLDTSVRHRRRFIIGGYFWWFSLKLPLFCYIHPLRMQSIRFPLSPPYILLMQHMLRSHNMYWHCYTAREYHIHYIQALNWAFSAKDSTLLRKAT